MSRIPLALLALFSTGCGVVGTCGEYRIATDASPERCGAIADSYGYTRDRTQILFSPTSGPITDWLGFWELVFDADYLEEDRVLDSSNARASCSRSDSPLGLSYLTEETADFEATLVRDKGIKEDDILGTSWKWVVEWDIFCPQLDMSATGMDRIELDADPSGFFPETQFPPPERPTTR